MTATYDTSRPSLCEVLIIEDRSRYADRIRHALEEDAKQRYAFHEISTPEMARRLIGEGRRFDLAFLSWQAPEESSTQLLETFRSDDQLPRFPVIVVSNSGMADLPRPALECGVQDYFTPDSLIPTVLPRIASNAIERHRLLRELVQQKHAAREAQLRAEEANHAKSAFLTGMSHELRTPLTAILGLAELLLENPQVEETRIMLEMIRNNGQHLAQLLADLMDLAKFAVGNAPISKTDCSVIDIARDLCDLMRMRASDEGLPLELTIEPNFPKLVHTDPIRFRQILMNLLSNSIKYTNQGRIHVTLRCSPNSPGESFEVEVQDTGIGISPELQQKLFMPFAQRDIETAGVGLGLSISRALAKALGGRLDFVPSNPPDNPDDPLGSIFVLRLPCGTPDGCLAVTDVQSVSPTRRLAPPPVGSWTGRQILIAEDTRANQFLLRRLLSPLGARLKIVNDGLEAVRAVEAARESGGFDLILMDMQMPTMDGYQATRRLRELGYRGVIVAITAAAMAGDAQKCLGAGCDAYVTKPFNRSELLLELDDCLQLSKSRSAAS